MIKWVKALVLGIIIWYLLSIIYGFVIGILDLDELDFFSTNSYYHNFIFYPVGIWLGFKITKTSYWRPIIDNKNK